MNKANKIDARYSVAQAIQETGQDICVAKINNSSFGLSEKDITCLFSKS